MNHQTPSEKHFVLSNLNQIRCHLQESVVFAVSYSLPNPTPPDSGIANSALQARQ